MLETFKTWLKNRMSEAGAGKVAETTEVSRMTLYNIVNGKTVPKMDIVQKIVDKLGFDCKMSILEKG